MASNPSYEQRRVRTDDAVGTLKLIAAPERDGGVTVHQDSEIFLGLLRAGDSVVHKLRRGRHGWVQVIDGDVSVNDVDLAAGDGAAVSDEAELRLRAKTAAVRSRLSPPCSAGHATRPTRVVAYS